MSILVADIDTSKGPAIGTRRRRSICFYLSLVMAAVMGAVSLLVLPSAYASGQSVAAAKKNVVTFGTQTATATKPDGRGVYQFAATPGGRIEDHVAVINYSDQTISVFLRGDDAVNTPQGGFAALPINERSTALGTWIALPASDLTVTLPARTDVIVPFLVEVPKNATPGDHVGVDHSHPRVVDHLQERAAGAPPADTGTRIFLRVSGPLHPGFTVEDLHVSYRGTLDPIGTGRAVLTYTIRNTATSPSVAAKRFT